MVRKEDIIAAVKKHPFIWDLTHSEHNDKKNIQRVWQQISIDIGGTEDEIKTKWKNIRDYYRKEVRRLQKLQNENGGIPVKSGWSYFKSLAFLNDTLAIQDSSDTNISLENDPFLEIIEAVPEDSNFFPDEKGVSNLDVKEDDSADTNDTGNTSTSRLSFSNRSKLKRPCHSDYETRMLELETRKIAILEKEITDDEDLLFFKSLLPDFKSLPRKRRIYLKMKYQEMLYDEIRSNTTDS